MLNASHLKNIRADIPGATPKNTLGNINTLNKTRDRAGLVPLAQAINASIPTPASATGQSDSIDPTPTRIATKTPTDPRLLRIRPVFYLEPGIPARYCFYSHRFSETLNLF